MARPTDYTKELAEELCNRVADGNSLRTVCLSEDMPDKSTIFRWFRLYKEFNDQYAQACDERVEAQHEDLLELGDEAVRLAQWVNDKVSNAVVSAVKLKADNMKWSMSKMKPKKYGDRIDHTTNGKDLPTPIYGGNTTINP